MKRFLNHKEQQEEKELIEFLKELKEEEKKEFFIFMQGVRFSKSLTGNKAS